MFYLPVDCAAFPREGRDDNYRYLACVERPRAPEAKDIAHALLADKKMDETSITLPRAGSDGVSSEVRKVSLRPLIGFQQWSREGTVQGEPIHVGAKYDALGKNQ